MKAMLLADLAIVKNYIWQQALLCIIIAIALCFGMRSLQGIVPAVAFVGGLLIVVNLAAIDENNGWEKYRLTLPLNHNQVVLGRYMSALVIILAYALFGALLLVLIGWALVFAENFISIDPALLYQVQSIDLAGHLATTVFPVCALLVFCAIMLPLALRFGLTKAVRFLPIVIFWGAIFAFLGIKSAFPTLPSFINDFVAWASTMEGMIAIGLLLILVTGILYALSCFFAIKVYQRREF